MIELIRFDLQKKDEWDNFYDWFSSYLSEVCDEEEYQENIDDLHNDELNAQMIEQTLQEHNPYFVMRIVENEVCVGLISYSYDEERNKGFYNNFYVVQSVEAPVLVRYISNGRKPSSIIGRKVYRACSCWNG